MKTFSPSFRRTGASSGGRPSGAGDEGERDREQKRRRSQTSGAEQVAEVDGQAERDEDDDLAEARSAVWKRSISRLYGQSSVAEREARR